MLDMLKNRLVEKRDEKGFTLAELLIVVAIIAVLIAISIPIFTSQLEKSREATDLANLRDVYAELSTGLLTNDMDQNGHSMTVLNNKTATTKTVTGGFEISIAEFPIKQKVAEWQTASPDVAGVTLAKDKCPAVTSGSDTVTFVFTIADDTTYCSAIKFGTGE